MLSQHQELMLQNISVFSQFYRRCIYHILPPSATIYVGKFINSNKYKRLNAVYGLLYLYNKCRATTVTELLRTLLAMAYTPAFATKGLR